MKTLYGQTYSVISVILGESLTLWPISILLMIKFGSGRGNSSCGRLLKYSLSFNAKNLQVKK